MKILRPILIITSLIFFAIAIFDQLYLLKSNYFLGFFAFFFGIFFLIAELIIELVLYLLKHKNYAKPLLFCWVCNVCFIVIVGFLLTILYDSYLKFSYLKSSIFVIVILIIATILNCLIYYNIKSKLKEKRIKALLLFSNFIMYIASFILLYNSFV